MNRVITVYAAAMIYRSKTKRSQKYVMTMILVRDGDRPLTDDQIGAEFGRLALERWPHDEIGPPDGWRYHGSSRSLQVITVQPSDRPPLAERLGLNTN